LCSAPQQVSFDDFGCVEPQDAALEAFLSGYPLVNRSCELLENFIAQQRPQRRFVAFRKRRDDHLKRRSGTFEKMGRVKARVGAVDTREAFGHWIGVRSGDHRNWRARPRFSGRGRLFGSGPRPPRKQFPPPFVPRTPPKDAA
jgi:hypothetical protein